MAKTFTKDIIGLFEHFRKLNEDCAKSDESVVAFTDTEYYSEQLFIMFENDHREISDAAIVEMAEELCRYAQSINYTIPKSKK